MFYVDERYSEVKTSHVYETLEEAEKAAQHSAELDNEGYFYYVNELKAIVRANRVPHPTERVDLNGMTKTALLDAVKPS